MVKTERFLSGRAKSWNFLLLFPFSKSWTNTPVMIFNDVCVMKPIVRRILEILRARMPLKLKVLRKTFPLGKIPWALCNNKEANLSKCLLILITPDRFLPLRQCEVAHSGQQQSRKAALNQCGVICVLQKNLLMEL